MIVVTELTRERLGLTREAAFVATDRSVPLSPFATALPIRLLIAPPTPFRAAPARLNAPAPLMAPTIDCVAGESSPVPFFLLFALAASVSFKGFLRAPDLYKSPSDDETGSR